ncbi:MAG: helix-hairpin-helix domain-containing protein, partial [Prevotellaceae bacterium]|nr:helix-hairpin-helix domain-containing protein [Prevotellaceae bacterium]
MYARQITYIVRIFISLSLFLFLFLFSAQAQNKDLSTLIADIIESVADKNEEETDDSKIGQLIDYYTYLSENPMDINTATAEELSQLIVLTDFQIFSLNSYIKEFGTLMSVNELILVPGYDEEIVSRISPFISTGNQNESTPASKPSFEPSLKDMLTKGRNTLLMRTSRGIETRKGYIEDDAGQRAYQGSPYSLFTRYNYRYRNNLRFGITADKDQGEAFFKGSNKQGFDFYSFHFMLSNRNHLKNLIIGDFRAYFGQGLALWNNFSFNKSSDVLSISKRTGGFSAYSSAEEVTYMRGIASTLKYGSWGFSPFVSHKKIDATMINDSSYTSLSANGLHRTENEIARKNALPETVAGINISHDKTLWHIGVTALYGRYAAEDNRTVRPYQRFELHEPSNANLSADYRWLIKNISLFGEVAISSNGGKAALTGITIDVNRRIQLSSLYRNYQTRYQAVYSNAFGENSKNANERGLYLGINILPHKSWKVSAFLDSYIFPWLRYGTDSPSSGWDYMVQANYTPNKKIDVRLKLQHDKAVKNVPNDAATVSVTQNIERTRTLIQANYDILSGLSMSSRIAACFFNPEVQTYEKGILISQDVKYKLPTVPLTLSFRYAIFDTDGWNSRLYAYESDVLYAFSVPAYYDNGARYFLNIGYKIQKHTQLWFRIAQTLYFEKNTIGSGQSTI